MMRVKYAPLLLSPTFLKMGPAMRGVTHRLILHSVDEQQTGMFQDTEAVGHDLCNLLPRSQWLHSEHFRDCAQFRCHLHSPPPRAAGLSWPRRSVTVGLLRGVPGCYLLTVNSYVCENVSEPAFPLHGLPEHSLGINKAEWWNNLFDTKTVFIAPHFFAYTSTFKRQRHYTK